MGAAIGAYGLGGPVALVGGLVLGAVLSFVAYIGTAIIGRHHLHGPIPPADGDLLETVIALATIDPARSPEIDPRIGDTAHELAWQLAEPVLGDAEYHQLRYQARMLAHAYSQLRQAQDALDVATSHGVGSGAHAAAQRVASDAADIIERLQARSQALAQVADQIRGIDSTL